MTENQQTEPTTTEPATTPEPQEEGEPTADPRLAAARKESIKYRERAKAAEGHAAELEKANAELQEKLLGYERVKAITESCEQHAGLTAADFNEFCHETEPDAMRSWAEKFASRLDAARTGGDGGRRVSMSGEKALSVGNGGRPTLARHTMSNAVEAAIRKGM